MNRYKQPKTEWKTDAWENKQIIQKAVKWSQTEGIVLLVGKPKDEIFPETFIYLFAPNMADITKPVEIVLTKNRQYIFGWKCELEDMDGIIGTMTANEAQIEGTGEKVNLFDYHVELSAAHLRMDGPAQRERPGECHSGLLRPGTL